MPRALREPRATRATGTGRGAFTLVELLVVLVIVMVISALTLAGLATARRAAKVDSTRTTIRKIHELVMPQYESYVRRRVPPGYPPGVSPNALARLRAIRELMVREMPDSWGDVRNGFSEVTTGLPSYQQTGPVLSYAAAKQALGTVNVTGSNGSAECLYMIAASGCGEPEDMQRFRPDEVGDTDGDRAPEFIDAWGRPIAFIRWAPGASSPLASGAPGLNSPVQVGDPTRFHDPLDPQRQDPNGFALVPLIVSGGPDGVIGLVTTGTGGWLSYANSLTVSSAVPPVPPDGRSLDTVVGVTCQFTNGTFTISGSTTIGMPDFSASSTAWTDNITNHDLMKK